VTRHLTDTDIQSYVTGDLAPAELLATDDHLAVCAPCREKAQRMLASGVDSLRDLQSFGAHLSDEDVQRAAREALEPGRAAAIRAHLRDCALCADQVNDLREWAQPSPKSRFVYYAAAAVVLLALLIPAARWLSTSPSDRPSDGSLAGLDSLPPADRDRVRAALANGAAEPPAFLRDLGGRQEVLMGQPPPPDTAGSGPVRVPLPTGQAFNLLAPIGTAILTDRPLFEWTAVAGAMWYRIGVFDDELRPVGESPELGPTTTTWQSTEPLARGRTYAWQVIVSIGGDRGFIGPMPPAPQARFRVLDADAAARLEQAARDHPTSHLLLGILYTEAGVRAEAERRLRSVPESDQYADVARRSLDRLNSFAAGDVERPATVPAPAGGLEARVVKVDGQMLYINVGAESGVKVGDRFGVFSVGEALIDPVTGRSRGVETETGVATVTDVQATFAIAVVTGKADARAILRKQQ
jgi:hypothetical protein